MMLTDSATSCTTQSRSNQIVPKILFMFFLVNLLQFPSVVASSHETVDLSTAGLHQELSALRLEIDEDSHSSIITTSATTSTIINTSGPGASDVRIPAALSASPNCEKWTADNRLECWLWQLKIPIPNESFSTNIITVAIQDFACSNFVLQGIQPTTASLSSSLHSLDLNVQTIQATCRGKYHANPGGISGNVQASVVGGKSSLSTTVPTTTASSGTSPPAAVQLSFRILPSTIYSIPRPSTFQTTSCQAHLKATNIHFSGSISAKLIQAFSKPIGHYITQALQEQVCPLLPKQLDPLVTQYLQDFDQWMIPYLPPTSFSFSSSSVVSPQLYLKSPASSKDTWMNNDRPMITTSDHEETYHEGQSRLGRLHSRKPDFQRSFDESSSISSSSSILLDPSVGGLQSLSSPISASENSITDFHSVTSILKLINQQLADHLQRDWIFDSNTTERYCPHKCQDNFRGFSGWFRNIVGSRLIVPLPDSVQNNSFPNLPMGATVTLGIEHLSIAGLDQLNLLQLLRPENNKMISHVSTDSTLSIQAPITLKIQVPENSISGGPTLQQEQHTLKEPFSIQVNLTQFDTLLKTSLSTLDWNATTILQIVDAVQRFVEHPTTANIKATLGCLIRTIPEATFFDAWSSIIVNTITITRQSKEQFRLVKGLEDDLDEVLNMLLKLLLAEYTELWTELIHGLTQGPAISELNHFIRHWLSHHSTTASCPALTPSAGPQWVNFSKFQILKDFNRFLVRPSTIHAVNEYLNCVGSYVEGMIASWNSQVLFGKKSKKVKDEVLRISGVKTKNWNTIQEIQLFNPTDDSTLSSSIHYGTNDTVPQIQINLEIETDDLSGVINMTFFAGLQAKIGTEIYYDLNQLQNLTVSHLLHHVQCGMVPMSEIMLLPEADAVNFGSLVGLNISALLNDLPVVYSSLDGDSMNSSIATTAAIIANWSTDWTRNVINKAFMQWVAQRIGACPTIIDQPIPDEHRTDETPMWYDFPIIWIMLVFIVLGQGAIFNVIKGPREYLRRLESHNSEFAVPLIPSADDTILDPTPLENDIDDYARTMREMDRTLLSDIQYEAMRNNERNSMLVNDELLYTGEAEDVQEILKPLLTTPDIPIFVRILMPVSIVGIIFLLFSSNMSVGASVDMSLHLAGNTRIHLPGLFQFSLGNTISEMYGAGIYPLLFLVVVFSGIWPYAKLIWMLYLWYTPFSDTSNREQRLLTLDALSKFSLVDTYVLVIMLVAFRFHLDVSNELGLDVFVTPEYGFYAFLMATCLSLIAGHGMLYFHRQAKDAELRVSTSTRAHYLDQEVQRKPFLSHSFIIDDNASRRPLSLVFRFSLLALCLSASGFLVVGIRKESFSFSFGGLAGMVLKQKTAKYSLWSLGLAISESVEDPWSVGVISLQVAFAFYAVWTPLLCLLFLLILLVYPMSRSHQKHLLVAAEIANAWSAVEVFVLSVVAALFQLSTFASFIVGDQCDVIDALANILAEDNILPTEDSRCFEVTAAVESDAWYLVVGVLLNSLTISIVMRLIHGALEEETHDNVLDQMRRSGEDVPNGSDDNVWSTRTHMSFAQRLYHLPMGKRLFFQSDFTIGDDSIPENDNVGSSDDNEENDEDRPDWRFWF